MRMRSRYAKTNVPEGYTFSGVYHREYDREKAKARAAQFRKDGYKARMINEEGGVSVYVEQKYFTDLEIESLKRFINGAASKKERMYQKHLEECAVVDQEVKDKYARLMALTGGTR